MGARIGPAMVQLGDVYMHEPLNTQNAQAGVASMAETGIGLLVSFAALLVAFLQLKGMHREGDVAIAPHLRREREAIDRLRTYLGRRDGLRRMDDHDTRALALRVHDAIELPTTASQAVDVAYPVLGSQVGWPHFLMRREAPVKSRDRDLPTFVERAKSGQVGEWMHQARHDGGFLVLVGNSCVGKTRLLYESARKLLGDFVVLAPDLGDGDTVNKLAAASLRLPKLIIWLDELQRFLDGPYLTPGSTPISGSAVRQLLDSPTPVVIVGTLWPEYAGQLRSTELDPSTGKQRARHPGAGDVLVNQHPTEIPLYTFSPEERKAAARTSVRDPRLAEAIVDRDYNVTEVLAGARELVRRYERSTEDQKAIFDAAVDARRLGIQEPLTAKLLCEAARGYLTQVYADERWCLPALAELAHHDRPPDRATSPLITIPNAERNEIVGFTVADYLLQRLTRSRRSEVVPPVTWNAFVRHAQEREDLLRLADHAHRRLLPEYSESIYRRLMHADKNDGDAAMRLVDLLAEQGRTDEAIEVLQGMALGSDGYADTRLVDLLAQRGRVDDLRTRVDVGDWYAAEKLIALLTQNGRTDEAIEILQGLADSGDGYAIERLANMLADQGRTDVLRARANHGDGYAAMRLADLLVTMDRADEAIEILQGVAAGGAVYAAMRLVDLLVEHGCTDQLRARADARDGYAAEQLINLLVTKDRMDEAIEILQDLAAGGVVYAATRLVNLLLEHGRTDEAIEILQGMANGGNQNAAERLVDLLADQGRTDQLRARADGGGDGRAARRLNGLLAGQGRTDELQARLDRGDRSAAIPLSDVLAKQGRTDEAIRILRTSADSGDRSAALRLADLLVDGGRSDELRARAAAGDVYAAHRLTDMLAHQQRTDELRARADAGDWYAAERLANLFATQGRINELRARADAGDEYANKRLIDLLATKGRIDELRVCASVGDGYAAKRLVVLLFKLGRIDELRARADAGDDFAARRLTDLLATQGRTDELDARAQGGDWEAADRLTDVLLERGRTEEAIEVLRVLADAGRWPAIVRLTDLLSALKRADELRAEINAGTPRAAQSLLGLLTARG